MKNDSSSVFTISLFSVSDHSRSRSSRMNWNCISFRSIGIFSGKFPSFRRCLKKESMKVFSVPKKSPILWISSGSCVLIYRDNAAFVSGDKRIEFLIIDSIDLFVNEMPT